MIVTKKNIEDGFLITQSEVYIIDEPKVDVELLLAVKRTKKIIILESKGMNRKEVNKFIDGISSFEFKLIYFCIGTFDLLLNDATNF
jgi:hypothetical protein